MNIIQFEEVNCKNCYKCIRHCELKAIGFHEEHATILDDKCVLCGKCTLICPQNAKKIFSDISTVKELIESKQKVYVSLAPSYVSAFPGVSFTQISSALKRLGFTGVEETAIGATEVSAELSTLLTQHKMKNVITTCCPSINLLIEKYYPALVPYLAPIVAPATAHARMIKNIYGPRAKVVFIGPCISKKHEAKNESSIHSVLLFDELQDWLNAENITFDHSDPQVTEMHDTAARLYPVPGGILRTVPKSAKSGYKTLAVDGLDRCIKVLDSFGESDIEGFFIEMSSCAGSCVEGPGMQAGKKSPILTAKSQLSETVTKKTTTSSPMTEHTHPSLSYQYNLSRVRAKMPNREQIDNILTEIGKTTKESMLNCGACGYNTCEDKAVAVFQGKADLHMCLPYLREKAESLSNLILDNTPNAIFVTDKNLNILEFNKAAQRYFDLISSETLSMPLYNIINSPQLQEILETGGTILEDLFYKDEARGLTLELAIVQDSSSKDYIVIARDITSQQKDREQIEAIRRETLETTQRVIDKQMRVAQEIASLLGETTGESKAALTKLKKSIMSGGEIL